MEIQQKIVVEPEGFEPEMNSQDLGKEPFGWEDQLYEEARDESRFLDKTEDSLDDLVQ